MMERNGIFDACFGALIFGSYVWIGTGVAAICRKIDWCWPIGIFLAMAGIFLFIWRFGHEPKLQA